MCGQAPAHHVAARCGHLGAGELERLWRVPTEDPWRLESEGDDKLAHRQRRRLWLLQQLAVVNYRQPLSLSRWHVRGLTVCWRSFAMCYGVGESWLSNLSLRRVGVADRQVARCGVPAGRCCAGTTTSSRV